MVAMGAAGAVSYGRRLSLLAAARPERAVIIFAPQDGAKRVVTVMAWDRA